MPDINPRYSVHITIVASSLFFFLSLVAVLTASLSISGFNSGWAYGSVDTASKSEWAPSIVFALRLGWWGYAATVEQQYIPVDIPELQGTATKTLGASTVAAASLAIIASLFLALTLASKQGLFLLPAALVDFCSEAVQAQIAFLTAGLFYLASMVLYLALAIGTHQKIKEQFGDNMSIFPQPSWAWVCAIISASCLLTMGIIKQQMGLEEFPEGYEPV